ncbi:MAG: tRNA preQ1(34) S-adenosylmethionine ribosyltransferase-isomerase QueA [Ruminococcaceae bacterium]|nr:tRNA preQ1(34) S-adenosylmethionine ribosyltransferase-isomerase QueA [Oscillospiraceae bacterium]
MDFLKRSTYNYYLPEELIAQVPVEPRDSSRLLVCDDGKITHRHFFDITEYLEPGDLLVINDSKVIPARLWAKRESGALTEVVLLEQKADGVWEALTRPGKKARPGTVLDFGDTLKAEVLDTVEGGNRILKFDYDRSKTFFEILDEVGNMPLPPYIHEKLRDKSRYQTVYAKTEGSAAAPTAGLHFTPELLEKIRAKGVNIATVMLHVGLGTFRPVKSEDLSGHKMHSEFYSLSEETAGMILETKKNGKKVIAVGTTSCRTLEGAFAKEGCIKQSSGYTDIFIYPGYKFNVIDSLITNFHLPESTLIMLVCALYGYDNTMAAYKEAVEQKYRFFSFGDAMLIQQVEHE